MNRRGFFEKMLAVCVAPMVLPSALTYARTWVGGLFVPFEEEGATDAPRIVMVDDSVGCTLTRADITEMTPAMFEEMGFRELTIEEIIASRIGRRLGRRPNLTDLLLERAKILV